MKNGWQWKKLGDVCKTGSGGTPLKAKKDYYEGGTIPWLLSGEVSQGDVWAATNFITQKGLDNSSARVFPKDTVLVAMYGATAGQVGILRFEAATNQAVCGILPNNQFVPEFLYYFLLSRKDELVSQAAGNAQPNISQVKIKNTDTPIVPLAEQQRIVTILDEAFASIATAKANAEKNLRNARAIFESHLQSVFTLRGEGWMEKRLGEVCSLITDGKHGDSKNEEGSGYYFLSAKDVKHGTLNFDRARQITKDDFEETHRRTNLKPNDICMVNTGATIGKLALAPDDPRTLKSTFQKSVAVIKTIPSFIDNAYCCYHLLADLSKLVNVSSGSAQKNLLLGDLKAHRISMPHLNKQSYIVARLDALSARTQRLESIYQQKLAALDALKKSLLDQAFTGQL